MEHALVKCTGAYSEPCQTSKMQRFTKSVDGFQLSDISQVLNTPLLHNQLLVSQQKTSLSKEA